jgi:hypothetical protein
MGHWPFHASIPHLSVFILQTSTILFLIFLPYYNIWCTPRFFRFFSYGCIQLKRSCLKSLKSQGTRSVLDELHAQYKMLICNIRFILNFILHITSNIFLISAHILFYTCCIFISHYGIQLEFCLSFEQYMM